MQFSVDSNTDLAPRSGSIAIFSDGPTSFETVNQDKSPGDFSVSITPTTQSVVVGNSVNYTVNVSRFNGFTGFVSFGIASPGLPAGVTASFSNFTCCSATLTITTSPNFQGSTVSIPVFGQNTSVVRFASATLMVQPPPDFLVSLGTPLQTVIQGAAANYNIGIQDVGSFTGPVHLSAPSLPGISISFNPNDTSASISTMTATTIASTPPGQTTIPVTITGVINGVNVSHSVTATLNVNAPPVALRFVPITPCRLVDTRNAVGPFGGPFLMSGVPREFDISSGSCGVPTTAQAYSINATVVPHGQLGFLTMYPSGQAAPLASTLNSVDGRTKAAAAIVPAGANGGVNALASGDTDLILDVNGYFVAASNPSALAFYPLTPCRISDTRGSTGPLGGPFVAGGTSRAIPVLSSACNVPSNAVSYSLNITVVPRTAALGFLTAWPTGQAQPGTSSVNAPTGAVTANAAIVTAGTSGEISVFASSDTDVIVDINGYFAPPAAGGLSLYTGTPCRIDDTRNSGGPPFSGLLNVGINGNTCGIPSTAQSYLLNATVVPAGPLGFLALWAQGAPQPPVSTLNAGDGVVTSNMAIVPGSNGGISAFATNPIQLILDVFGYFAH